MAMVLDVGPLQAELAQLPDILRALIHTILLLRSLGTIKIRDATLAAFDLTHAQINDDALDALVERSIADLLAAAERSQRRELTVAVSFFELRHRPGWFAAADERVVWEQWRLHLCMPSASVPANDALEKALFQVVRLANERREHLVPVVENKASPVSFPFDIALLATQEGGLESLRRLMTSRSPMPPML